VYVLCTVMHAVPRHVPALCWSGVSRLHPATRTTKMRTAFHVHTMYTNAPNSLDLLDSFDCGICKLQMPHWWLKYEEWRDKLD